MRSYWDFHKKAQSGRIGVIDWILKNSIEKPKVKSQCMEFSLEALFIRALQ